MKLLFLTAVLFAATAYAKCPNACSGHGTCGEHDMCSCYRNWQSADCSERVCPYHHSFVTTPQGDLNMDGDLMDGNIKRGSSVNDYSDPTPDAATAQKKLVSIANPHGTWEAWPAFATAGADEGHFYMECSNRGLCDRKTGECECFDGYEGRACARTVCPEGCNGHGTCESVAELAAAAGNSYKLWDSDKSYSCKCDAGYTGPSCASRQCPFGDDPLVTTTYESKYSHQQSNEKQFLDIIPDGSSAIAATSYLTLTYTDVFGETWNTTGIQLSPTATTTAANVESALEAIPNNVFVDVDVTALSHLESLVDGKFAVNANAGKAVCANVLASTHSTHSCNFNEATFKSLLGSSYNPVGGWNADVEGAGTWGSALTVLTDDTTAVFGTTDFSGTRPSNVIRSANGQRLVISFNSNPGDLSNLSCQVDNTAAATSFCLVRSRLPLCTGKLTHDSGVWSAEFDASSTTCVPSEATSLSGYAYGAAGIRYTATANTIHATATDKLASAVATTDADFTFDNDKETVTAFQTAFTAGYKSVFARESGAAWQYVGEMHATTNPTDAGVVTLAANSAVAVTTSAEVAVITQGVSLGANCGHNDYTVTQTSGTFGSNKVAVGADASNQDLRGCNALSGTATETFGPNTASKYAKFSANWDGTTERLECSRRGLCDSATGICSCFKGYTLDDCSLQSVLAS